MAVTLNLEAHELDQRGIVCDRCGTPGRLQVDIAIVSSESLQVLTRASGSHCGACGDEDAWRY